MTFILPMNQPPWKPVAAIVTSVEPKYGQSRTLETDDNPGRNYFLVHFRYTVDGRTYAGDLESRSPLEQGRSIEILYNPDNPQQNSTSPPAPARINKIIFWTIVALLFGLLAYLAKAIRWRL